MQNAHFNGPAPFCCNTFLWLKAKVDALRQALLNRKTLDPKLVAEGLNREHNRLSLRLSWLLAFLCARATAFACAQNLAALGRRTR